MSNIFKVTCGILLPFVGTTLGSAAVFFLKPKAGGSLKKCMLGFASGVMLAASCWSLLIPASELAAKNGGLPFLPPVLGFLAGVLFVMLPDVLMPPIDESRLCDVKTSLLAFTVSLHNVPEGMAVGVALLGALSGDSVLSLTEVLALSVGIAVQNIPEGAIISMPYNSCGKSKFRSFLYGALSGIVEPLGACLTFFLTGLIRSALPYILSFAAGAMVYVVSNELIPSAASEKRFDIGTLSLCVGFALMMLLDIAFG